MEKGKIEAMQFNNADSYCKIATWMKECGGISAEAGEVQYMTNVILFPGVNGYSFVRKGEWLMRNEKNEFTVVTINCELDD